MSLQYKYSLKIVTKGAGKRLNCGIDNRVRSLFEFYVWHFQLKYNFESTYQKWTLALIFLYCSPKYSKKNDFQKITRILQSWSAYLINGKGKNKKFIIIFDQCSGVVVKIALYYGCPYGILHTYLCVFYNLKDYLLYW